MIANGAGTPPQYRPELTFCPAMNFTVLRICDDSWEIWVMADGQKHERGDEKLTGSFV
jgi:hypothetical protein